MTNTEVLRRLIANTRRSLEAMADRSCFDGYNLAHCYEDCAEQWDNARQHGGQLLRDAEYNLSLIASISRKGFK